MSGPTIDRAASSGDIWTPWLFIRAVEKKFGPIGIDLAASGPDSAKALEYITPEDDSLTQDWTKMLDGRLGWDNPPFSDIAPWAAYHAQQKAATLLLVPGSIGANWYWDYVHGFAAVYSVGRMKFDNCFDRKTGLPVRTAYPKDLILCAYNAWPINPAEATKARDYHRRREMMRWRWANDNLS